jgi:serine/threonine-protein kinase
VRSALARRYLVERELGRGGVAVVYLGIDLKHQRKVAIKVLRRELSCTLAADRFLREIEIAARLTHPHIVSVHDSGKAEDFLYFVMPFIDGESLRARLQRDERLAPQEALRFAREIAGALDYAHRNDVVHLDIKPENILLYDGHAIVADFGIARAISAAGTDATDSELPPGTPLYMSPEQIKSSPDLDGRTDVYSLGCVLHEMLVGRPPEVWLHGDSISVECVTHVVGGETYGGDCPPGLEATVARALAEEREDRFSSAADLAAALERHASAKAPERGSAGGRSLPLYLTTFLIVAVLIVTLGWWRGTSVAPPNAIESIVVLPFENVTSHSDKDRLAAEIRSALIADLTQFETPVVLPSTAVQGFAETSTPIEEIAQALDVDALVVGTVETTGDDVRITTRVLEGSSGQVLLTHTHEGKLADLLALRAAVAQSIVRDIKASITSRPPSQ